MELGKVSKFKLCERLGGGTFGDIYSAENEQTSEYVAVKIETVKSKSQQLLNELKVYKLLEGGVGIPHIKYYGMKDEHNALVMDLLGKSIENLFQMCNNQFSLKTVLMIADQLLTRIEYLHHKNLIHRDIKPENFVVGRGNKANQIFMIDLGLAKRYCDQMTHKHNEMKKVNSLIGTAKYASINSHLGNDQSRRDDLESIAYVLIYLMKGSLPWQKLPIKDKKEKIRAIKQIKIETTPDELCEGIQPEFCSFLKAVRNLSFEEKPDYSGYREMFRDLFIREGYIYDCKWDWVSCLPPTGKQSVNFPHNVMSKSVPTPKIAKTHIKSSSTIKKPKPISKNRAIPTLPKPLSQNRLSALQFKHH